MAIEVNGSFSGLVGTVVMYKSRGQNLMRAKPKKLGRKPRKENLLFGTVSRYGSAMMRTLKGYFLFPVNMEVFNMARGWMSRQYKMNHESASWPLEIKPNQCTRLHPEADLRDFFAGYLQLSDEGNGKLLLGFPAIDPLKDINSPADTLSVNMKIIVVTSPFNDRMDDAEPVMLEHVIPYQAGQQPAVDFQVQTMGKAGDMALLIIALEFKVRGSEAPFLTDRKWLPANVLAFGKLG